MPFQDAHIHRSTCAFNLSLLSSLLLSKYCKQDSSLAGCQVVRNAPTIPAKIEAQLSKLSAKLPTVRLV